MGDEYDRICQMVKRTKRTCLLLGISVLLLAVAEISHALTLEEIVGTFEFLTEQLDLIGQKVDGIAQGLQSLH